MNRSLTRIIGLNNHLSTIRSSQPLYLSASFSSQIKAMAKSEEVNASGLTPEESKKLGTRSEREDEKAIVLGIKEVGWSSMFLFLFWCPEIWFRSWWWDFEPVLVVYLQTFWKYLWDILRTSYVPWSYCLSPSLSSSQISSLYLAGSWSGGVTLIIPFDPPLPLLRCAVGIVDCTPAVWGQVSI